MSMQPQQQPQGMSGLRIFWIIWCSFWALGWMLVGFGTLLLGWLMVPVSLFAILLPVGKQSTPQMIYFDQHPSLARANSPLPPAGWYPDPSGSGGQRYWDGSAWR